MKRQLHAALHESFHSRGLPTPPLPTFRRLPSDCYPTGQPPGPMVLRHFCNVHYATHTSWGHTPTLFSHPVYPTGPHVGPTQGSPRMVDTRHPSQLVGRLLPTLRYSSPSGDTRGPLRTLQHRCRGTLSQGECRASSLSSSRCHS
jgi:hypothetical protein